MMKTARNRRKNHPSDHLVRGGAGVPGRRPLGADSGRFRLRRFRLRRFCSLWVFIFLALIGAGYFILTGAPGQRASQQGGGPGAEYGIEKAPPPWVGAESVGAGSLGLPVRTLAIIGADGRESRWRVEIADTQATRARGLMFRRTLAPDSGMLLTYPTPQPVAIWMKNTYIPLDLLYIDARDRVKQIVKGAVPLSEAHMVSAGPVKSVLELPAGSVARYALAVGDRVVWPDEEP